MTYEYVTGPNDRVHVTPATVFEAADVATICGRPARGWRFGDETVSGISASCPECKRLVWRRRSQWSA